MSSSITNNSSDNALNYFQVLPEEIKGLIFSFLKMPDLTSASSVSQDFNTLSNDQHIWAEIMKKIGLKRVPNATTSEMKAKIKKIHETGTLFLNRPMASEPTVENTQETLRRINEIKIADTRSVWKAIYDQAISNGSIIPRPDFAELKKSTDRKAIKQAFADWIENNKDQIILAFFLLSVNLHYLPKPLFNLTQLLMLNLSFNNRTSIPEEIGNLTQLRELHLSCNNLTSIPKEIGNLILLQRLDLSGNNLTSIPKEIGKLTQLQRLYLSGNNLTSIPKEIGKLTQLQWLDLSGNNLTSIPKEIGKLTQLQELYLSGNNLTSIPKEIGNLIRLQRLDLSSNFIIYYPYPELLEQLINTTIISDDSMVHEIIRFYGGFIAYFLYNEIYGPITVDFIKPR